MLISPPYGVERCRRSQILNPESGNSVNNEIQKEILRMPSRLDLFGMTMYNLYNEFSSHFAKAGISRQDFDKLSKEEVYRMVPWQNVQIPRVACDMPQSGGYGSSQSGSGESQADFSDEEDLQGGYEELYEGDEEERNESWKEAIAESYNVAKSIGKREKKVNLSCPKRFRQV